jgi:hypothetical protein
MTNLEEWQVETIENTLRLVANHLNSAERASCLCRDIMQCWNWCVDALNDVPIEQTSKNGIMYRMRTGQYPILKPREKKRQIVVDLADPNTESKNSFTKFSNNG